MSVVLQYWQFFMELWQCQSVMTYQLWIFLTEMTAHNGGAGVPLAFRSGSAASQLASSTADFCIKLSIVL